MVKRTYIKGANGIMNGRLSNTAACEVMELSYGSPEPEGGRRAVTAPQPPSFVFSHVDDVHGGGGGFAVFAAEKVGETSVWRPQHAAWEEEDGRTPFTRLLLALDPSELGRPPGATGGRHLLRLYTLAGVHGTEARLYDGSWRTASQVVHLHAVREPWDVGHGYSYLYSDGYLAEPYPGDSQPSDWYRRDALGGVWERPGVVAPGALPDAVAHYRMGEETPYLEFDITSLLSDGRPLYGLLVKYPDGVERERVSPCRRLTFYSPRSWTAFTPYVESRWEVPDGGYTREVAGWRSPLLYVESPRHAPDRLVVTDSCGERTESEARPTPFPGWYAADAGVPDHDDMVMAEWYSGERRLCGVPVVRYADDPMRPYYDAPPAGPLSVSVGSLPSGGEMEEGSAHRVHITVRKPPSHRRPCELYAVRVSLWAVSGGSRIMFLDGEPAFHMDGKLWYDIPDWLPPNQYRLEVRVYVMGGVRANSITDIKIRNKKN